MPSWSKAGPRDANIAATKITPLMTAASGIARIPTNSAVQMRVSAAGS